MAQSSQIKMTRKGKCRLQLPRRLHTDSEVQSPYSEFCTLVNESDFPYQDDIGVSDVPMSIQVDASKSEFAQTQDNVMHVHKESAHQQFEEHSLKSLPEILGLKNSLKRPYPTEDIQHVQCYQREAYNAFDQSWKTHLPFDTDVNTDALRSMNVLSPPFSTSRKEGRPDQFVNSEPMVWTDLSAYKKQRISALDMAFQDGTGSVLPCYHKTQNEKVRNEQGVNENHHCWSVSTLEHNSSVNWKHYGSSQKAYSVQPAETFGWNNNHPARHFHVNNDLSASPRCCYPQAVSSCWDDSHRVRNFKPPPLPGIGFVQNKLSAPTGSEEAVDVKVSGLIYKPGSLPPHLQILKQNHSMSSTLPGACVGQNKHIATVTLGASAVQYKTRTVSEVSGLPMPPVVRSEKRDEAAESTTDDSSSETTVNSPGGSLLGDMDITSDPSTTPSPSPMKTDIDETAYDCGFPGYLGAHWFQKNLVDFTKHRAELDQEERTREVFGLSDKLKNIKPYVISGWISTTYLRALMSKADLVNEMFDNALDTVGDIRQEIVENCRKNTPAILARDLVFRVFTLSELNNGFKLQKLSRNKLGAIRRCVKRQFPKADKLVWANKCVPQIKSSLRTLFLHRVKKVQDFWLSEGQN